MTVTNYFVEVHPGEELEEKIQIAKTGIIELLGDETIDDPDQSRFIRDDPHFTLLCARTGDLERFVAALQVMSEGYGRVSYGITDVEERETPEGLLEIRTVVEPADRLFFRQLHLAAVEASLPFNTAGIYERFEEGFDGEAQENIDYCGFPFARNLFAPHASLGRVHPSLRKHIQPVMSAFHPIGTYTSGDLIVWRLPYEKDDPTATPTYETTIPLRGD